jgi:hypothetical protein
MPQGGDFAVKISQAILQIVERDMDSRSNNKTAFKGYLFQYIKIRFRHLELFMNIYYFCARISPLLDRKPFPRELWKWSIREKSENTFLNSLSEFIIKP